LDIEHFFYSVFGNFKHVHIGLIQEKNNEVLFKHFCPKGYKPYGRSVFKDIELWRQENVVSFFKEYNRHNKNFIVIEVLRPHCGNILDDKYITETQLIAQQYMNIPAICIFYLLCAIFDNKLNDTLSRVIPNDKTVHCNSIIGFLIEKNRGTDTKRNLNIKYTPDSIQKELLNMGYLSEGTYKLIWTP